MRSLSSGATKILIICVYLPTNSREHFDEYVSYLGKIHSIVDEANTSNVYILGDWNANLLNESEHGLELVHLCAEYGYIISDAALLDSDTYTYVSEAHVGTTSWLDHCVCTASAHTAILDMSVLHDFVSSDHLPLLFSINVTDLPECSSNGPSIVQKGAVNWAKVTTTCLKYPFPSSLCCVVIQTVIYLVMFV
jgi:endonuclease/exonuclease/phosphatase family metal-dependent hydrolase